MTFVEWSWRRAMVLYKGDPIGRPILVFCVEEGMSHNTMRKLIRQGEVRAFRVGRKLMIDVGSYREFVQRQQEEGVAEYGGTRGATEARRKGRAEVDLGDLGLV